MNRLTLEPVSEEPSNEENCSKKVQTWRKWLRNHFPQLFHKKSNLKILLSVLGCPLFPLSLQTHLPISQVSSSAEYIIQHFAAATNCRKPELAVKNMYATGKVAMAVADESAASSSFASASGANAAVSQKGCFVMWQMLPNKWLIELVVAGHKVVAGSDGSVAWRHTPWLGAHAARGGVRPLRRALQGLDPVAISTVFSSAQYMGEKHVSGTDCFVLKLSADHPDLVERSDNTAEMIKHVILGYFSQRSGLLVFLEDSFLTRIQAPGSQPTYWETSMCTKVEDYRPVEGMMVSHSGQTCVVITRFGDKFRSGHGVTRMEETYTIDDLAFNVPGLSMDSFIPPQEMQRYYADEDLYWKSNLH